MGAHVDSGDLNAGMTTMSCFREGDYGGAYLVFPRYGIDIRYYENKEKRNFQINNMFKFKKLLKRIF